MSDPRKKDPKKAQAKSKKSQPQAKSKARGKKKANKAKKENKPMHGEKNDKDNGKTLYD